MGFISSFRLRRGFALPTVLIASVVLLIVLAVSVTATTSARNALKDQYYAQLAQVAGEAGVAYAEACLQANNNVVTWSDAQPLTPATNCNGVSNIGPATCPTSSQCWVSIQDNIRSSFSVPAPEVDADGRPVLIPQTGYVEIWRASTNTAWRVYRQPTVQPYVVPALCSGSARSDLGWNNVLLTTQTGTFPDTTAKPITIATGNVPPGPAYYRKDFNIVEAGTYTIRAKGDDRFKLYIDGAFVTESTSDNQVVTANVTLTAGCHVVQAEVTNGGIVANATNFTMDMKQQGGEKELLVTDASWRTTAANTVSYSDVDYYQSPDWQGARTIASYNSGTPWSAPSDWATITGDLTTAWIGSSSNFSGNNYPFNSYTYFRSTEEGNYLTATSELRVSVACDDSCTVYLDGNPVLNSSGPTQTSTTLITVPAGYHKFGIKLYNGGASNNPAGFLLSVRNVTTNTLFERGDGSWFGTNGWYASEQTIQSYGMGSRPSPDHDDCQCTQQKTTNIHQNPSSETNDNWYWFSQPYLNATRTRSTAAALFGSYGQRVTVSTASTFPRMGAYVYTTDTMTAGDFVGLPRWIEPGQQYTLSGYIRSSVPSRIGYSLQTTDDYEAYTNGQTEAYSSWVNPGGNWTRFSITTGPIPVGGTKINVWFGVADNTPVGTVFDVDGVMVTPGPNLYAYRDGSYASDGWSWLGTAHGYVSVGPTAAP